MNANPATKKAIFNKWAPQDPDYSGANPATQSAIRLKFGVEDAAAPKGPTPEVPPMDVGVPEWGRKYPALYGIAGAARETLGPTIEAVGAAGGGVAGSAAGPAGTVGGTALGYGIGKQITRLADQALGNEPAPTNAFLTAGKDVLVGGALEAGGRGIVAPAVGGVMNYMSKVKNLKFDTYFKAAEGKADDIIAALRGAKASSVPGAAPTAGEVAAPVSGTKFATLQARSEVNPEVATQYAEQAAQSNQARLSMQDRVTARFQGVVDKVKAKIDRGLVDVSQKEVGEALTAAAKAEQQSVKSGVVQPAYEEAFKLAGNAKVNVGTLVDEAETILKRPLSSFSPETMPNVVRSLLQFKPKAPAGPAPAVGKVGFRVAKVGSREIAEPSANLQQLDDLRKAINADIAAAKVSTDPSAQTTLRNLGKLHDTIDEVVQGAATLSPEAKAAYAKALQVYREQYVPRFKTGVNANIFKTTGINEQKILPDDVVSRYFAPQGERKAVQFVDMFGKNPNAMTVARSGIEDLFRRKATDAAGNVVPQKAAQFMKDYARPIEILDKAGMNLSPRFDIIAKDAARLAKIQ